MQRVRNWRLAEAEIEFTKDMIQDGATLTIGDQTFTFKTDPNSAVTGANVIDVSAMDQTDPNFVDNVAAMVTKAAGNNALFTVGYDKNGGNHHHSAEEWSDCRSEEDAG